MPDKISAPAPEKQAPTQKRPDPLAWGDRYLELALRCYAAAMLSDRAIEARILAAIGCEPIEPSPLNPQFERAAGRELARLLDQPAKPEGGQ